MSLLVECEELCMSCFNSCRSVLLSSGFLVAGAACTMLTMKMRRLSLAFVVLVALVCAGCDSLHHTQYVVADASASDKATIKSVVETSASEAGFADKTETSKVPDTIVFYLQPVPHFPVSLGARRVGEFVVVDLSCFHPGVAKPPAFKSLESSLTETLALEFGERLTMPDYKHLIPITFKE